VIAATAKLRGSYAVAVVGTGSPGRIVGARRGSPLVAGIGDGEHFLSSDVQALIAVTQRFIHLEEGDFVEIGRDSVEIFDAHGQPVVRALRQSALSRDKLDRGSYRHYTQKEIFEQPRAIADTLEGRIADGRILPNVFGVESDAMLRSVRHVRIVACGTSFHAGLVARYWIEAFAGLPCSVEVASEYRYRHAAVPPGTLFLAISQSGETADTLAALRDGQRHGYAVSMALCNVPESSLVRESDLVLMTRAGPEIGVASTKAFTTQLCALAILALELGRINRLEAGRYHRLVEQLARLPQTIAQMLALDTRIAQIAERFVDKRHAVFLGRGVQYPVALEGALKLKEISYIHAEGYPAGELKHGPLALVDQDMPVIVVAPDNQLLEKLRSNMEEVRARGGQLFVFADSRAEFAEAGVDALIQVGAVGNLLAPAAFTVPLQLLAYHVAVLRGTDVDQPRNLAKSVTVE
jgi:glucosamine--fructose-6-phosphate aminotransferase (isomerizing)